MMPAMTGLELAARLESERPALKTIFMSGQEGGFFPGHIPLIEESILSRSRTKSGSSSTPSATGSIRRAAPPLSSKRITADCERD